MKRTLLSLGLLVAATTPLLAEVALNMEKVEKFKQMTGVIESRRTDPHQTAGDLCYTAAEYLLKEKGIDKSEIGALVMSTQSPDYRRPSTSFIIHKRMGLSEEAAVFDMNLGCSSVLYGIQTVWI